MSHHASELCTLLVNDIYGELSSRVFSTLQLHGRLPLSSLLQHTRLPPRQLKHGLAVLIQQHLVLHYFVENQTQYEADWKSAYSLVRTGGLVKLVEERFGEMAKVLVSDLMTLGHARVGDLREAYGLTARDGKATFQKDAYQMNGEESSPGSHRIRSLQQLYSTLGSLLEAGFVVEVTSNHFRPVADSRAEAERLVLANEYQGVVKAKDRDGFLDKVNQKMAEWRDGNGFANLQKSTSNGVKRRRDSLEPQKSVKRMKMEKGLTNGLHGSVEFNEFSDAIELNENLVVRVSYEKYVVACRSRSLMEWSKSCIGSATALVYAEVLKQLERKIPRCREEFLRLGDDSEQDDKDLDATGPTVSTLEVSRNFILDVDLGAAIGKVKEGNIDPYSLNHKGRGGRKRDDHDPGTVDYGYANPDGSQEEIPDYADDYNDEHINDDSANELDQIEDADAQTDSDQKRNRMMEIKQHLQLLAEDPRNFVTLVGNNGMGEWRVKFRRLIKLLTLHELENTIAQRFGGPALRIVRILIEKGKLDEKQVHQFSLLQLKDVRAILTAMQSTGQVEIQEVPRDNSRQPSRTTYLWFFDEERCRQLVLEETFKSMARCLQRVAEERISVQGVIDKAERTDVVGKEEKYLSPHERAALQRWKDKEERLLGEIARLDAIVGLLSDF